MNNYESDKNKKENNKLVRHVAIIMDGNGRWAVNKGKLRIEGHREGIKAVIKVIDFAIVSKLEALTLYVFSSENWIRPTSEISSLMKLFLHVLNTQLDNLHKKNIKLKVIGDISLFSRELQEKIKNSELVTSNNNGLQLNIAANYGGRWDIIQAVKKTVIKIKQKKLSFIEINDITFSKELCMSDLAPVDLVIRTGGEYRISNFLIWQISYSELYFTDVLWPDFDKYHFKLAIHCFLNRKRNFGGSRTQ
ncbi:polyprenyl diphosphate synthase [Buchnera aphidicola]|nr:polyprenyl diphosphate synthase [Buchnera aphidicola]